MALPLEDTAVEYPSGTLESASTVLYVHKLKGVQGVVLRHTPFHPIDSHWPDQPADRGRMILPDGTGVDILDAQVGATDGVALYVGADVPVRTGTDGWSFVVVHIVAAGVAVSEGDRVGVVADAPYRDSLSAGHTACHLAALALDRVLQGAWSKPVATDPLGAPAFDALAIQTSQILEDGARDTFRIGRSLRKKGFDQTAFDDPADVARRVDRVLAAWVDADAPVRVEAVDSGLSARRFWVCDLPEGEVRIPCGGTHVRSLGELGRVTVRIHVTDAADARQIEMDTVVARAQRDDTSSTVA